MDDLISRQAAIDTAIGWLKDRLTDRKNGESLADRLKHLPSAQQWTPCSERLPEHDGELYLVTSYCEQINRKRLHTSYCYVNREGFWSDVPLGYKVIAWMPLPEPYKGE